MKRHILYILFLIGVTFVLLEIVLRVIATKKDHITYLFGEKGYYLAPLDVPNEFPDVTKQTDGYGAYDADLGWSYKALGSSPPLYYADRKGVRCSKSDFEKAITDSTARLPDSVDFICIGNSFTHGDEVIFEETWPFYLGKYMNKTFVNLGVGGYGIDQATLRYLKSAPKSKVVLLGLISGDLDRAYTQIYGLPRGGLKTKPIFNFENNDVNILNVPAIHGEKLRSEFENPEQSEFFKREQGYPNLFVRSSLDNLYTVRVLKTVPIWKKVRKPIYRTDDERLAYCINILSYLNQQVQANGSDLFIVILDNLNTFEDWKEEGKDPWVLFKNKLEERKINYLSMDRTIFDLYQNNPDSVINKGMIHYTANANALVARWLAAQDFTLQNSQ
jgi:hypothetical protein